MARLKDRRASPKSHSACRLFGMLSCEYRPELINSGYRKAVMDCDGIEGSIVYVKAPSSIIFLNEENGELGVTGDEMGWPCNTHVEPLTVKVNLGMEKSATMVLNDPNQASPRITSASATRRTKRGTLKVNLLILSGVLGKRLLHSRNWPLSTITGKGVMGAGLEASRAAMRRWMMLCVLSQSKRTMTGESLVKGSGGRGFGVGSKAVVAGLKFGFAVRAGVTGFGSGLGVENRERGVEEVFLLLTASNLGTGSASWWCVWPGWLLGFLGMGRINNARTIKVSNDGVVDVYDGIFNFSESDRSTKNDDSQDEDADFVVCDLVQHKGVGYGSRFSKGLEDVNRIGNVFVHVAYIDNRPQMVQMCDFKLKQERSELLSPTLGLNRFKDVEVSNVLKRSENNHGTYGNNIKIQRVVEEGRRSVKVDIWKWPRRKKTNGIYCHDKNSEWKFDICRWPKRKKETWRFLCRLKEECHAGCLGKKDLGHYWKDNSMCLLTEDVMNADIGVWSWWFWIDIEQTH
nr:hypothetical protein [Tanacetum cinerariifolium]